jgi:HAE1 family hydrophobic/amphiphilic exporter-1/multidrug efflux pump
MLTGFLKVRWMAWIIVLACVGIIYFVYNNLQSELAPLEDKSSVRFQMFGRFKLFLYGRCWRKTNQFLSDSVPEKDFVFAAVPGFGGTNINSGIARIRFIDPEFRTRTQSEIARDLSKKLGRFNEIRVFPIEEQTISVGLGSRGSLPVQFILQNLNFEKLKTVIPQFLEEARKDKTFQSVDVNLKFNKPELQLTVDRIKAKDLGLSITDISEVIQSAFSGRRLAYYIMNGKQYEVISQVAYKDRQAPKNIPIYTFVTIVEKIFL